MYLEQVLRSVERSKTLSCEDLYKLNEAIFNLPEEENVDKKLTARLFKAVQTISKAYTTGKYDTADANFFYDYVALLCTQQNQYFFSEEQNERMLQMLVEACGGGPTTTATSSSGTSSKQLVALQKENERLKKELAELSGIADAVMTLKNFKAPVGLVAKAKDEPGGKDAKGKEAAPKAESSKEKGKEKEKANEPKAERERLPPLEIPEGGLAAATWNISAVNNNPFEYWITHDDPLYAKLMADVEGFIEEPGDRDVAVGEVLDQDMLKELVDLMKAESWEGVDVVEKMWDEDYSKRKIVSGFLKDKGIGSKRLASMPDRITNTIRVAGKKVPMCRPSIVNNYTGQIKTVSEWWPKWRDFMFKERLDIEAKGEVKSTRPCEMLGKISKAKYPALTEEEERVSLPLQTLCQAIFDAVMVHIMVTLSPDGRWAGVKSAVVKALYKNKDRNTVGVIRSAAKDCAVICLQEGAAAFIKTLEKGLGRSYHVVAPADVDPKRDQNSILLLKKSFFPDGKSAEVTDAVMKELGTSAPVEKGDILAVTATSSDGKLYLLASFHGDTNGLATKQVVSAVQKVVAQQPAGCRLVFGLDANTYLHKKEGVQDVEDFLAHCKTEGLVSCWPEGTPMEKCFTTCIARTFLQPQLNKAVKSVDKLTAGTEPKDHILVSGSVFAVDSCYKDNTGQREYKEDTCFPSLRFPSDHGLVSVVLKPQQAE